MEHEIKPLRPSWLRARLAKWAGLLYRLGLGAVIARQVMILTTRGRATGVPRRTPLWYVRDGDTIYCVSGWGSSSDWLKNLEAHQGAVVRIGRERWETQGTLIQEPAALEKTLGRFQEKYGRRLVHFFYHIDRLRLVAFPLLSSSVRPETRPRSGHVGGPERANLK